MARRLYVARDAHVTVVSRGRVRMGGARRVDHPWSALADWVAAKGSQPGLGLVPRPSRARRALDSLTNAAFVVLPPVLAGSITATFAPVEVGFAVGGGALVASSALAQPLRQRLTSRSPRPGRHEAYTLSSERPAFLRTSRLPASGRGSRPRQ